MTGLNAKAFVPFPFRSVIESRMISRPRIEDFQQVFLDMQKEISVSIKQKNGRRSAKA